MKVAKIYLNGITNEIETKKGIYCFAEIVKEVVNDVTYKLSDITYKVNIISSDYSGTIHKYLEHYNVEILQGDQVKNSKVRKIENFVHDHTVNRKEKERYEV